MSDAQVSDDELLKHFIAGCHASFESLVSRYETKVYSLALRLTRNTEDAEEVLQDVFVTVYRKADSFQGKAKFSSWLYRVTANAAFMKLRKRKQHRAIALDDLLPQLENQAIAQRQAYGARADALALTNEIRDALTAALDRLPEEYRRVFILRDVNGLSNKEVSSILELSIPAVKSRLHRSRLMLRRRLQRFYDDYSSETRVLGVGPSAMQPVA